jgi:hypothetical protein
MAGSAFGHDYRMDMEWSDEESFRQDNSIKNWCGRAIKVLYQNPKDRNYVTRPQLGLHWRGR